MFAVESAPTPWAAEWAWFRTLHDWLPQPFFQTHGFLVFCSLALAVYWFIPRRWNTLRVAWLVFCSVNFYAAWNAGLAFLVTATTLVDYALARGMDALAAPRWRRALLIVSVSMNLGVLAYFKYRGFFLNELHGFLSQMGVDPHFAKLDLALMLVPFGISFYTFEAISYAVDVSTRRIRAERRLAHFLLFILFFPHLVAGPIVRAGDFLRQSRRIKRWNWLRVRVGLQLFVLGLVKKFAFADRLAVFADPVFADPAAHNGPTCWLALLAYSLRIYFDFSGYSDMAVGVAHLFGFKLVRNFAMPYCARNVSEFWHRWHMSLSTWLRDYVFIPLGGSRGGEGRTCRNLMIVMALGGLWHGANWTYLAWGVWHGGLLVLHRQFRRVMEPHDAINAMLKTWFGTTLRIAITFFVVTLGWVMFRPEWDQATAMLGKLFALPAAGATLPLHHRSLWWTVVAVVLGHAMVHSGAWASLWTRARPVPLGVACAIAVCIAQLFAPITASPFIYFTF
jgi:D-alanyl-lipoteichoic acid acyltransferase DltB (MBOAT superfamily)